MRMNLRKTALAAALGVVGLIGAGAAQATKQVITLQTGDVLAFTAGPTINSTTQPGYGSYFDPMGGGGGESVTYVGLQPGTDGGIEIGTAQASGAIDQSWSLGSYSGSDFTVTGTSAISGDTISGVVPIGIGSNSSLDMSNWRVTYDGATINLGGSSTDSHEATFAWKGNYGGSFTLDYEAHVPSNAAYFKNQDYKLHMVGAVEPVPLPAAAWLFGSGLLGLLGIARRKKSG